MTDEELDSFEVAAKKMIETSCGPFASFYNEDFSNVILDLIAELRQARAERDWLVQTLEDEQYCYPGPRMEGGILVCEEQDIGCEECDRYSKEHWLKAAKEAVK